MKVQITFVGLCMFVAEKDGTRTHMLMPRTDGHSAGEGECHHDKGGHGGVPAHYTVLSFDSAYSRRGATKLDGRVHSFSLDGRVLEFSGAAGRPDPKAARKLVNVSKLTGRRVRSSALTDMPQKANGLHARVTLTDGGAERVAGGAFWKLDNKELLLPHILTWQFTRPGGQFRMKSSGMGGEEKIPVLYPIKGSIVLRILHGIAEDHLPDPPPVKRPEIDDPAEHFRCFYHLLEKRTGAPAPVPRFERPGPFVRARHKAHLGGAPFNCMLAQGDPPP